VIRHSEADYAQLDATIVSTTADTVTFEIASPGGFSTFIIVATDVLATPAPAPAAVPTAEPTPVPAQEPQSATVSFKSASGTGDEGTFAYMTLVRSGAASVPFDVAYSPTGGNAQYRINYYCIPDPGTIHFDAGEMSKTIKINLIDDGLTTRTMAATFTINSAAGASIGDLSTCILSIRDTTNLPVVEFSAPGGTVSTTANNFVEGGCTPNLQLSNPEQVDLGSQSTYALIIRDASPGAPSPVPDLNASIPNPTTVRVKVPVIEIIPGEIFGFPGAIVLLATAYLVLRRRGNSRGGIKRDRFGNYWYRQ
jgi:hypothetical protein